MGMQGGFKKLLLPAFVKQPCYRRAVNLKRLACKRIILNWNAYNIENVPLIDPQKILLPPIHIMLGLMKKFVKAIEKCNSNGFTFLCQ